MKKYIVLVLIVLVALVYILTFNMSPIALSPREAYAYSKEGFIDANTLEDEEKEVYSNGLYTLYIDETTSYFKVVNNNTGYTWYSNPEWSDPWRLDFTKLLTNSAKNKQQSTVELSYYNERGSVTTMNNYQKSISHPASPLNEEGYRSYGIKYIQGGFQVLYTIEDIGVDYTYFPKYISASKLASMNEPAKVEGIYNKFDSDLEMHYIGDYEGLSEVAIGILYEEFYGEGGQGYTYEMAMAENTEYGLEPPERVDVSFEVAVQVLLTPTGVETSILKDSIVEQDNAKLSQISLYPYFGTAVSQVAGEPTEGYLVVPDGSGAVIEFNNGKENQQPYKKRLYGEDIGILDYKMAEVQNKISIPLYGMVKEDNAFAAIITKGDAMASINADVSERIDSYNKIYTSWEVRENESVTIGSGYNSYGFDLWTEERVDTDFTVEYFFLDGSDASYAGIASVYRDYLVDNYGFTKQDTTSNTQLTAEFIGSYDKKDFIFGVPYYTSESLTTFKEAQVIIEVLKENGIDEMNVLYQGMINGGLTNSLGNEFKVERVLGGNRRYNKLLEYTSAEGIDVYPVLNLMTTSDYNKTFDQFRYTSKRIDGSQSLYFTYHLPSKLPYSETPYSLYQDRYIINPAYYNTILNSFTKDYDGSNIAFNLLGNSIGGSYGDDFLYKQDALRIQNILFNNLEESIALSNPNGYGMGYSDLITDLPLETTLYAIFDYQIPLLQLVLSGYVDYSTVSLNMANERSMEYNFLKVIETGSNLKYTMTYDDSKELKNTQYNYYLSTQYENWVDQIGEQVNECDELGIHNGYIVQHEQVMDNVYRVTYSHGLQIVINYNLVDVLVSGVNVPSLDYYVEVE